MPNLSRFSLLLLGACGAIEMPAHQTDAGMQGSGSGSGACVPESDADLCAHANATCEEVTATDNCGQTRTAACGTCGGTDACVANSCQAPVCNSLSWPTQSLVTSLNDNAKQDAVLAISGDSKTVLTQRSSGTCGGFQLIIADSNGTALVPQSLAQNTMLQGMRITQEATLTLTPDGLTIIGVSTDGHSFLSSTRAAFGGTVFAAATGTDFANLSVTGNAVLGSPVISADGLEFFYDVLGDGIYESVRASKNVPFPAGTKMPADIQTYGSVSGISSDRMTLFLGTNTFSTVVFTRKSVKEAFSNPNAPGNPPTGPGFRTRPSGDCQMVIATSTPGGCQAEEVATWSH
ncbi:MAG: hypothetical protein QM831_23270 [Kofleriaceae bacterium]